MIRRCVVLCALVLAMLAGPGVARGSADERTRIAALNVAGQAGVTVASAAVQGIDPRVPRRPSLPLGWFGVWLISRYSIRNTTMGLGAPAARLAGIHAATVAPSSSVTAAANHTRGSCGSTW
jgi:hypothetical protein